MSVEGGAMECVGGTRKKWFGLGEGEGKERGRVRVRGRGRRGVWVNEEAREGFQKWIGLKGGRGRGGEGM